jgi:prevent-host-death family protein
MQRIGSREFKNRMGRYMRAVRQGQTLILTERGKAVARVSPEKEALGDPDDLNQRLRELEKQGLIRLPLKGLPKFRPIKSKGRPASRMIIEDRR